MQKELIKKIDDLLVSVSVKLSHKWENGLLVINSNESDVRNFEKAACDLLEQLLTIAKTYGYQVRGEGGRRIPHHRQTDGAIAYEFWPLNSKADPVHPNVNN